LDLDAPIETGGISFLTFGRIHSIFCLHAVLTKNASTGLSSRRRSPHCHTDRHG
jgi:hypothetical protein